MQAKLFEDSCHGKNNFIVCLFMWVYLFNHLHPFRFPISQNPFSVRFIFLIELKKKCRMKFTHFVYQIVSILRVMLKRNDTTGFHTLILMVKYLWNVSFSKLLVQRTLTYGSRRLIFEKNTSKCAKYCDLHTLTYSFIFWNDICCIIQIYLWNICKKKNHQTFERLNRSRKEMKKIFKSNPLKFEICLTIWSEMKLRRLILFKRKHHKYHRVRI